MYPTVYQAQMTAANEADKQMNYHVYVYELKGEFGIYWHHEDRYVSGFLPSGAKILAHGKKEHDSAGVAFLDWEIRSNHTREELNILKDALGCDRANAIWNLINDE